MKPPGVELSVSECERGVMAISRPMLRPILELMSCRSRVGLKATMSMVSSLTVTRMENSLMPRGSDMRNYYPRSGVRLMNSSGKRPSTS